MASRVVRGSITDRASSLSSVSRHPRVLPAYITARPRCPQRTKWAKKRRTNRISEYIPSRKSRPVPLVFPAPGLVPVSYCGDGQACVPTGPKDTPEQLTPFGKALAFTCVRVVTARNNRERYRGPPSRSPVPVPLLFTVLSFRLHRRTSDKGPDVCQPATNCRLAAMIAAWAFVQLRSARR